VSPFTYWIGASEFTWEARFCFFYRLGSCAYIRDTILCFFLHLSGVHPFPFLFPFLIRKGGNGLAQKRKNFLSYFVVIWVLSFLASATEYPEPRWTTYSTQQKRTRAKNATNFFAFFTKSTLHEADTIALLFYTRSYLPCSWRSRLLKSHAHCFLADFAAIVILTGRIHFLLLLDTYRSGLDLLAFFRIGGRRAEKHDLMMRLPYALGGDSPNTPCTKTKKKEVVDGSLFFSYLESERIGEGLQHCRGAPPTFLTASRDTFLGNSDTRFLAIFSTSLFQERCLAPLHYVVHPANQTSTVPTKFCPWQQQHCRHPPPPPARRP